MGRQFKRVGNLKYGDLLKIHAKIKLSILLYKVVSFFLFVAKYIANRWTEIGFLYSVASCRSTEGL